MSRWRGLGHAWWVAMRAATRRPVTVAWPHEGELPFDCARASIVLCAARCDADGACVQACPTGCLTTTDAGALALDLGACIGCGRCIEACPCRAVAWSPEPAAPVATRAGLIERGGAPASRAGDTNVEPT